VQLDARVCSCATANRLRPRRHRIVKRLTIEDIAIEPSHIDWAHNAERHKLLEGTWTAAPVFRCLVDVETAGSYAGW
jgi:hypothetical protein